MPTLTCEHCESEIDVAKDPRCVLYGSCTGSTDVICEACRGLIYQQYGIAPCIGDLMLIKADNERARLRNIESERQYRIKRGWRA